MIENTHETLLDYYLTYQSAQRMGRIAIELAIQTKDPHVAVSMINEVNP